MVRHFAFNFIVEFSIPSIANQITYIFRIWTRAHESNKRLRNHENFVRVFNIHMQFATIWFTLQWFQWNMSSKSTSKGKPHLCNFLNLTQYLKMVSGEFHKLIFYHMHTLKCHAKTQPKKTRIDSKISH